MKRLRIPAVFLAFCAWRSFAAAQSYDPPANYYNTATGTGAALKQQLNDIIDGHTDIGYDAARSALQVTDSDPNSPGHMITVYDRTSVNVAAINPNSDIPGWDSGDTWNREHTWPRSRGVGSSGPDDADLFELRPALTSNNGDRGNLNYGGAFGQPWGVVTDNGASYWYPGDADAGMIARQEFYMSVRYDGTEGSTSDLEIGAGNPAATSSPPQLGNLNRLIEWNYLAPPDNFERRRNQIIYDQYQHNRNPFTDRPEYVWSVFVNQTNDSSLTLQGAAPTANAATTLNVDLGRVLVGASAPAAALVMLNKAGLNGTYYQVTTAGAATSSVIGRYNAFATGATGSKTISVGLNTTTATAGLKSGTVTIDNLDITTMGGAGKGASDGNDTVNVTLSVLGHANPSFSGSSDVNTLTYDFGTVTQNSAAPTIGFDLANLVTTAGFTAGLDLDSIVAAGQSSVLTTDLATFPGAATLAAGASNHYLATFDTSTVGQFSASYTLNFSDENVPGAASLGSLVLNLNGIVQAPVFTTTGDFNGDGIVDGADYLVWQSHASGPGSLHTGDANGDGLVNAADLAVWTSQFGFSGGGSVQGVPEPSKLGLIAVLVLAAPRHRLWRRSA